MAEIAWTEEVQRWLEDIFEYIAADTPQAAGRTVQGIYERAQVLTRFPEIGYRYLASSRNVRILLYGHFGLRISSKTMAISTSLVFFTVRSISRDMSFE